MDGLELETAIEELETRVERLRALYEQFFMGIEKIPPHVVQKDVDRRLYQLRRAQIRNTARRFKLQTIVQRYNTFQQYWMRIMREIENGTYRRHVLRAERTMGTAGLLTAAERKRLGLPETDGNAQTNDSGEPAPPDAPPAVTGESNADDGEPRTIRSPSSMAPPKAANPRAVREQIERDLARMLGDPLGDEFGELSSLQNYDLGRELDDPLLSSLPPPPARKKKASLRAPSSRSSAPSSSSRRSASPKRPPTLAPEPEPTQQGLGPVTPPRARASREDAPADAGAPSSQRKSIKPDPVISVEAAKAESPSPPRQPLAPAAPAGVQRPGVAPPAGQPARGLRLPAQSAVAGRGLPPPPKAVGPAGAQAIPAAPKAPPFDPQANQADSHDPKPPERRPLETKPTVGSSANTGPASPRGLPSIRESVVPRSSRESVRPRVEASTPSTPRGTGPVAPKAPQPKPAAEGSPPRVPVAPRNNEASNLGNDEQFRTNVERVADKMREARKVTKEGGTVSVDALSAKLSTTKAALEKTHPGKRIDFDVVIKDGKAIVKPIVR